MPLANPCLTCGEPTTDGPRCSTCESTNRSMEIRTRRAGGLSAHQRGYDSRWTRLSRRARELQPFCSDCGATDNLECDHTPEAWQRRSRGLAIRLEDVDVVCGPCNRRRGAARGKHVKRRSKPSKPSRSHWGTSHD